MNSPAKNNRKYSKSERAGAPFGIKVTGWVALFAAFVFSTLEGFVSD